MSTAKVDALSSASAAKLQQQEALHAMEPAVPFTVLVDDLPGLGEAVEPVSRVWVGLEEEETDIAAPQEQCYYLKRKTFALVAVILFLIILAIVGIAVGVANTSDNGPPEPTQAPVLIVLEMDKLTASDGAANDEFGGSCMWQRLRVYPHWIGLGTARKAHCQ